MFQKKGWQRFPNLQAGSYVYLEEGQVEVSNAAGSRLISPGQVVRVSGPNNQIEVMPALVELFQSQSLLSFQSDRTEGFAVRELADEANQLIDRVIEGNEDTGSGVSDFSTKISALGLFGDSETGFDVPGTLVWAGTGENRYVQSMNISHVDDGYEEYQLTGNSDSAPSQLGYQQVLSESGQVVSQLHWGVWEEGTFTADDVVFDNEYYFFKKDWHFMLADNVLTNSEVQGLTGRYRYSYVGGTDMSGYLDDAPDPSQMTLEEGTFVVNFDAWTVGADLTFSDGTTQYRITSDHADTYSKSLDRFFEHYGLYLSSTPDSPELYGDINGLFSGLNGEGIISTLILSRPDDDPQSFASYYYYGSAAFQKEFTELNVFGGVTAFETDFSFGRPNTTTVLPFWGVGTESVGTEVLLTSSMFAGTSSRFYDMTALVGETPLEQGGATVTGETDSVEVYWGIWDQNAYQVIRLDDGVSNLELPQGGWHYMIADNAFTADEVEVLGLTGTFTYNYGGGTTLIEGNDGLIATIDPTSTINVDFANLGGQGISYDLVVKDNGGSDINFLAASDLGSLYSDTGD